MLRPAACACGIDMDARVVPEHLAADVGNRLPADGPSMAPAHDARHRNARISGEERIEAAGFDADADADAAARPLHRNAEAFLGLDAKE